MAGALDRWMWNVKETKRQARVLERVVHRLLTGALVSTFERWRDHLIEDKQLKSKAVNVIHRCLTSTLEQIRAKAWKVIQRIINSTLLHKFDIDLKVVACWRKKVAAMCVYSWQNYISDQMRKQTTIQPLLATMLNIISRLREKTIVNCVESWPFYVAKQMRDKTAV